MKHWGRWSEPARAWAAVGVVLVVGVSAEWRSSGFREPSVWVPDLAVGVVLAIAAAIAWMNDGGRVAWLVGIAGLAWFAGNLAGETAAWVSWPADHLALVHRAVLFQALVTFPLGRVRSTAERTAVAVGYAGALLTTVATHEWWMMLWATGLFVAYVVVVARRSSLLRAASMRALPAMIIFWATLIAVATLRLTLGDKPVPRVATAAYEIGIVATAIVLVIRIMEWRTSTVEVADAVVEVTFGPAGSVRDLLADALRDPTVEVAFAVTGDASHGWVDEVGRPVAPLSVGQRTVTPITVDGRPVAEIASTVDFDGLPKVLAAVSSATRLAAENARLRSRLRRQIDLLEASRLRLLSAADEERLRLGRQLDREAGRTMTQIRVALQGLVRTGDASVDAATQRSLARVDSLDSDLSGLATGLGPAMLSQGHLADALEQLAESSSVAVDFELTGFTRIVSPPAARAIYFACAEGITNAIKHAAARTVRITLEAGVDGWILVIADDGCGGADVSLGSGLQGLVDRVEALGGHLRVASPVGAGTRLAVELPFGEPDGDDDAW